MCEKMFTSPTVWMTPVANSAEWPKPEICGSAKSLYALYLFLLI
jgi:hypothetical protein